MNEPTHEIIQGQDGVLIRIHGHGTSEYSINIEGYGLVISAKYINSLGAISEDNLSIQATDKNKIAIFL